MADDDKHGSNPDRSASQALAAARASMDGKLDAFDAGRPGDAAGVRDGYVSDAVELMKRLSERGFVIVPKDPPSLEVDWGKPQGNEVW